MKHISIFLFCSLFVIRSVHGGLHETFHEVKDSMRHSTSSIAVDKGKKYLDDHEVTSAQVRELIESVSFEDYKVELAEYAYACVNDKKIFLETLKNSLYPSSLQALREHIEYEENRKGNLNELICSIQYSTSSSAVEKACRYLDNCTVTSSEVKMMLKALSYDRDRLEIAKYAYPHVKDKKNYLNTIEDELFLSSTRDLKTYIAKIDRLK